MRVGREAKILAPGPGTVALPLVTGGMYVGVSDYSEDVRVCTGLCRRGYSETMDWVPKDIF